MGSSISSRKMIKIVEMDGWFAVRQNGSHIQFKHPTKPGTTTIPIGYQDLPIGTVKNIKRQAGI